MLRAAVGCKSGFGEQPGYYAEQVTMGLVSIQAFCKALLA